MPESYNSTREEKHYMNDLVIGHADATSPTEENLRIGRRVLLPNEPDAKASRTQAILTNNYLIPVLAELEAFFLALRASVDPVLQRKQPVRLGKPYPSGQCLEITQAVQLRLRDLEGVPVSDMAARGRTAFCDFRRAAGQPALATSVRQCQPYLVVAAAHGSTGTTTHGQSHHRRA